MENENVCNFSSRQAIGDFVISLLLILGFVKLLWRHNFTVAEKYNYSAVFSTPRSITIFKEIQKIVFA